VSWTPAARGAADADAPAVSVLMTTVSASRPAI
jgi:hypothetical protein